MAGAVKRRRRQQRILLLLRLSRRFGDIILLAQALGILANLVWFFEISHTDFIQFIYVGGDLAGLFAYFGFMLFGILFFSTNPFHFWRSLHPVNLGLCLILLATHQLWKTDTLLIALAALIGALIGRFSFRWVLAHPRLALLFCTLTIPLGRYVFPYTLLPYSISCYGALLITWVWAAPLLRLRNSPR